MDQAFAIGDAPGLGTTPYGSGCQAFVLELCRVSWPPRFKPEIPQKYDGMTNPIEFLQLHTMVIQAAGALVRS